MRCEHNSTTNGSRAHRVYFVKKHKHPLRNRPYSTLQLALHEPSLTAPARQAEYLSSHKSHLKIETCQTIAVDDEDGGNAVKNDEVKNPVFLYDDMELTGEYFWESLAKYLGVDDIPHDLQQLKESRLDHDKELANVKSLDF